MNNNIIYHFMFNIIELAKVEYATTMIYFHIILHSAVHINDFHIFRTSSSSFHGFTTNQFNDLLPAGLLAQLVRALHRYRRGQGFEFRTSLKFFSGFLSATAKVAYTTAMICFHIIIELNLNLFSFSLRGTENSSCFGSEYSFY